MRIPVRSLPTCVLTWWLLVPYTSHSKRIVRVAWCAALDLDQRAQGGSPQRATQAQAQAQAQQGGQARGRPQNGMPDFWSAQQQQQQQAPQQAARSQSQQQQQQQSGVPADMGDMTEEEMMWYVWLRRGSGLGQYLGSTACWGLQPRWHAMAGC